MKKVRLPLDHLAELWPDEWRGARVGALLHPASVSSSLKHASQILEELNVRVLRLTAFFGPQHGFLGQTQDNMIEWASYEHPRLGIPVHSLYGETREPTAEMLENLDLFLIDLQDVGARYYTFIWTMFLCLRACASKGLPVLVLDRPNPLNGLTREGPVLDPSYRSFVGLHPLPVRHGLTIGELAERFREEAFPRLKLTVLPMKNWERAMWFDQTGLRWVMPSPNMPTLETATVYPGMCLLEGTNLSEGRGTTRPFEIFGAPFIESESCARELNALRLPGVYFREHWFQPTFHKFAGEFCGGVQLHVLDRNLFQPFATGLENRASNSPAVSELFQMEATALRIRAGKIADRSSARRFVRRFLRSLRFSFVFPCALAVTALAANPDAVTDRMSDDDLRAFRKTKIKELQQRLRNGTPSKPAAGTSYDGIFFCTLYFTPKESGFTAARGFNATPVRARGLRGRKYPADFLRAVKKEGFGRLIKSVDGHNHIRWLGGGRYGFAKAPVGWHGQELILRRSCAISRRNPFLRQHDKLIIKSETVKSETGSEEWVVTDTGPAVERLQIDLYWGDDEPRGAGGRQPARPAGTWMEYAFETRVTTSR